MISSPGNTTSDGGVSQGIEPNLRTLANSPIKSLAEGAIAFGLALRLGDFAVDAVHVGRTEGPAIRGLNRGNLALTQTHFLQLLP